MSKIYKIWFQKVKLPIYLKHEMLLKVTCIEQLFALQPKDYKNWGLTEEAIYRLEESKKHLEGCHQILKDCMDTQTEILDYFDPDYPQILREIPDCPIVLYIKGNKQWLTKPMIAMVGARKCTEYGDRMARQLSGQLSQMGIVVVSGLAMGVDAASHQGALQKEGGTVAVLGTGCDLCYPQCNQGVYDAILEKGCLVSEYPPYTKARPYHFPLRNRMICGLSYGVVVVEAAERSGSLITAKLALDYGREVYAVGGDRECKMSQGTNELIASGAKSVKSAVDIIEELPKGIGIKNERIKKNSDKMHNELAQAERIVYAYVSWEPILLEQLQELLVNTQLSCERLYTSLLQLEVKGLIKRLPGERYVRI